MDYTMKGSIDPVAIAQLAQRQAQAQAENEQKARAEKNSLITNTANAVAGMVSQSIEASKTRQKDDMVKNLANSMAAKYAPNVTAPQMGPGLPTAAPEGPVANDNAYQQGEAALPPVSTPDYAGQNAVKASVMADPKTWAKLAAEVVMKPQGAGGVNAEQIKSVVNPDGSMGYIRINKATGEVRPVTGVQSGAINPDQRNKTLAVQTERADAQTKNADTNASKFVTQTGDKLATAVDPTKLRDYDRLTAGKRLSVFVQATQGKAIKQQVVEASSLLASMLQGGGRGGVVSEKLIEQLTPSTAKGTAKEKLQWLTNHPESVDQQKFLDIFEQTAIREATAGEDNIRQQQVEALKKYEKVRRLDPKRYKEIQQSVGLGDDNVDSSGRFVRTATTRSVLPNYNDQTQQPGQDDGQVHALASLLGLKKKGSK